MDLYDALALAAVAAKVAVIYVVWRLLNRQQTIADSQVAAPRRANRRVITLSIAAVALAGSVFYVIHFGQCDFRSKFCVVAIAGTRSEIGCEWETWNCYLSTYPEDQ